MRFLRTLTGKRPTQRALTAILRRLLIVIVPQTICCGVGLWIHFAYINATATHSATERVMRDLDRMANRVRFELQDELRRVGSRTDDPSDSGDGNLAEYLSRLISETDHHILVTDLEDRLVAADKGVHLAAGTQTGWHIEGTSDNQSRDVRRGRVSIAGTLHPAMSCQITSDRRVIFYRPTQSIRAGGQDLAKSLPGAAAVAFLWIAGLQAVIVYLVLSRMETESRRKQQESQNAALRRAEELVRTQEAVIFGLARLAESRDTDTGQHLERIAQYATRLAVAMQRRPNGKTRITPALTKWIGFSSALHDIGKVGVEDAVLKKPGPLTAEERVLMERHTEIGGECLRQIEKKLGASNFLQMAREIALGHHEWWDGSGYPNKLAGRQIPIAARIVSIADVYDALSQRRCYKEAYSHERCVEIIRSGSGTQFDPEIVEVFLEIQDEFAATAHRYGERQGHPTNDVVSRITTEVRSIMESVERRTKAGQESIRSAGKVTMADPNDTVKHEITSGSES